MVSPQASPSAVWDGGWHYAVGTFDGQRVRLYLDGVQVGAGTIGALGIDYGGAAKGVFIGTYRGSCDLPFTGDIDEVNVHSHVLTPGQVDKKSGQATQQPPPPQPAAVTGPPAQAVGDPARGCARVGVYPKRLVARRRTSLLVSVRKSGRPASGLKVTVRGSGLARRARTGRRGKVRLSVRPSRGGRVRVTPRGEPRRCSAKIVRVAKR